MSHVLRTEVFFSVHGEDVKGNKLSDGGPGELRIMYVNKPVVLPAVSVINRNVRQSSSQCFLIPEVLDLPICKHESIPPRETPLKSRRGKR